MSEDKKVKVAKRGGPKKALLLVFGVVFAAIGAVLLWQTQAAPGACSTGDVIGSATYTVSVPETAQYRIWVRIQVPDMTNTNNTNGLKLEIDANQCFNITATDSAAVNQWIWVNSDATASSTAHVTSQISAGSHTMKLLGMKAGVKVDKVILLKSDNTCIPSNNFSNGDPGENCTTSAPVVTITATPTSVVSGNASTLNWSATDADSCTASGAMGWDGGKLASGTQSTGALTAAATFTLTCAGIGGSGTGSATVNVTQPPAPTLTLTANPSSVISGSSSILTWSVSQATSCNASGATNWTGSKNAGGGSQSTGALTSDTTYSLTCTGAGGSTTRTATVTVTTTIPTDTTPPNVVFTIPGVTLPSDSSSVLVRNQREITWQPLASDASGVTNLALTVNNQAVSLSGGEYKFGGASNNNGDYVLRAVATDTLGNNVAKTVTIQLRHPDFNRDGLVNSQDLSRLLRAWGTASTNFDLDAKNNVGVADLSYLMRNWHNP